MEEFGFSNYVQKPFLSTRTYEGDGIFHSQFFGGDMDLDLCIPVGCCA
jgi:hypothetical protein